jgi:hypothetical protein
VKNATLYAAINMILINIWALQNIIEYKKTRKIRQRYMSVINVTTNINSILGYGNTNKPAKIKKLHNPSIQ